MAADPLRSSHNTPSPAPAAATSTGPRPAIDPAADHRVASDPFVGDRHDPLRRDHDPLADRRHLHETVGDGRVGVDPTVESRTASVVTIVTDLIRQIPDLFRKETQLLRVEMSEKAGQAARALGMIAASLVLAQTALIILALGCVAALEDIGAENVVENPGLGVGWSSLIVGGGFAIIALILALKGMRDLKASNLAPNRTAHSLQKDADLARGRH